MKKVFLTDEHIECQKPSQYANVLWRTESSMRKKRKASWKMLLFVCIFLLNRSSKYTATLEAT